MREAEQIIILGFNGTGKTTITRKFVERAIKNNEKALIITPDFAEWKDIEETTLEKRDDFNYTGARRYVWEEDFKVLVRIAKYFFNGLLVFDDCRCYLTDRTPPELKRLFIRRRQYMMDIILCGHGFTDVPPKFFTNTSKYILFMTNDVIGDRRNMIRNFEDVQAAQLRINERAKDTVKAWVDPKDISKNKHYYEIIKP
jgi:Cdc6-like AAA superfamily ATPase